MYRIEYIPSVHAVPHDLATVPEHSRCESPKIYRFMVQPHASRTPSPSCDENKQTLRFEAEQIKMFFDFFPLRVRRFLLVRYYYVTPVVYLYVQFRLNPTIHTQCTCQRRYLSFLCSHRSLNLTLYRNPHNTHNNIHPLPLAALILVAPHPISLIVPVRSTRTMHAPSAHLLLLIGAHAHTLLGYAILALFCTARSGFREVLDDRAVDCEFVLRLRSLIVIV